MNQNEFYTHLAKRLGITIERAKELADNYVETILFFVKKKNVEVPTKSGTFKIVRSRNGFPCLTLDERPRNADNAAHVVK